MKLRTILDRSFTNASRPESFDPFADDMRNGGRYYPPDPVEPHCTCVAPCEAEPAGAVCAFCEERAYQNRE